MSRKMKDSGIEWIGEIPEEWEVSRIKNHLKRNEPRNPGDKVVLSLYRNLGIVPKDSRDDNHNVTSLDTSNYKYVCIGDFVINKMKAWQGSVAVSDYEGIVSPAYYVYNFSNSTFVKKYFHYLIRNCYKDEFRRLSGGIREGQWDLSSENFDNTLVIIPDKESQTAIASYLDTQCAHIDNIIEKTKASIEEYKKLKQAVITQAVTKGIRGDRPMKDSGIEWIGEIPEEWEVTRMKYCAELSPKCNLLSLHEKSIVEYLPMEYVKNRSYIHNTALYGSIPHSLTQFQNGDIIFAKVTPCFENGNIAIPSNMPSGIGFGSSELYVLRTIKILKNYLFYWIQNSLFVNEACATMTGTGGLKRVSSAFVRNSYLPYPSAAEQSEIAAYLDKKCDEIDAIITKKQQFITEMESYKKSMIYEYVTGKKEVPKGENRIEFSPDFKVALLMCKILQNTEIKGRIHMQKVLFSSDILLNLFELQYYRFPHGPYDVDIQKYEQVLSQNGWVDIEKSNGSICYKKTERFDDFTDYYQELFSDKDNDIKKICQAFNVRRTAKAEKMATVLASWNDFLIDGVTPTDETIVNDIVTNWTENKANINISTWYDTISKLKEQGLIPKGFGKKTLSEEAAKNVY